MRADFLQSMIKRAPQDTRFVQDQREEADSYGNPPLFAHEKIYSRSLAAFAIMLLAVNLTAGAILLFVDLGALCTGQLSTVC